MDMWIILAIIGGTALLFVMLYNKLVALRQRRKQAYKKACQWKVAAGFVEKFRAVIKPLGTRYPSQKTERNKKKIELVMRTAFQSNTFTIWLI